MERDVFLSQGLSQFLQERTFNCSDEYYVFICNDCGKISPVNQYTNKYCCKGCNNYNRFSKINLPYSCKLLFQELMSMCIVPRITTD